jgi:hypothetical protein
LNGLGFLVALVVWNLSPKVDNYRRFQSTLAKTLRLHYDSWNET